MTIRFHVFNGWRDNSYIRITGTDHNVFHLFALTFVCGGWYAGGYFESHLWILNFDIRVLINWAKRGRK